MKIGTEVAAAAASAKAAEAAMADETQAAKIAPSSKVLRPCGRSPESRF